MLALPGKNPYGNIIHLVVGPETDFFLDMHGAAVIDVTEYLNKFDKSLPVFVCFTRAKSEQLTQANLMGCGGVFISNFGPSNGVKVEGKEENKDSGAPIQTAQQPTAGPIVGIYRVDQTSGQPPIQSVPDVPGKTSKCAYCGAVAPLLPLKGYKICESCCIVELGVNKARRGKVDLGPQDTVKPTEEPVNGA